MELYNKLNEALPLLLKGESLIITTTSRSYRATLASPDAARMAGGIQDGGRHAIAFGIFIYRINNTFIHLIWL